MNILWPFSSSEVMLRTFVSFDKNMPPTCLYGVRMPGDMTNWQNISRGRVNPEIRY